MSNPSPSPVPIPPDIREALAAFCAGLGKSLGGNLVSVLLYGGLAKGEFVPAKSDVNVMVVLNQVGLEAMDQIRGELEAARRRIPLNLLTLASSDIEDSAEVFSIKFLDIQRHHLVLFGVDATASMVVPRERLRRQCSRDLMNLLLRLRQFYLQRAWHPEQMESALVKCVSSLFTDLAIAVELETGREVSTKAEVIEGVHKMSLNVEVLKNLAALKAGESRPDAAGLRALFAELLSFLGQAIERLNANPPVRP